MKEANISNNIEIIDNVLNQYIKKGSEISGIQFIYYHKETTKPSEISIGYSSKFPEDIKKRYYKIQKNRYGGITSSMRLKENKILNYINYKCFKKNDKSIPILFQIRITDDNKIGFFMGKTINNEITDFGNNDFTLAEGKLLDPYELTTISVNIWNLPKTWQGEINKLYFYFDKGAKVSDLKWIDKNGKVLDKNRVIIENFEKFINNKNKTEIIEDISLKKNENENENEYNLYLKELIRNNLDYKKKDENVIENISLKNNENENENENEYNLYLKELIKKSNLDYKKKDENIIEDIPLKRIQNKISDEIYLKNLIKNILDSKINDENIIEDNSKLGNLNFNLESLIREKIIDLNKNSIIDSDKKTSISIDDILNNLSIHIQKNNELNKELNNKLNNELNSLIKNAENLNLNKIIKEDTSKNEEIHKITSKKSISIRDEKNLISQIENITGIDLSKKKKKKERTKTKNDIIDNLLALIDS
jgi:hypothetical protein